MVVTFTRLFFREGKGGKIARSVSQKIKKRTLGCVAGVYGKFTEPHTLKEMEVTLLQYDVATINNSFKSRKRLLRIKLKPTIQSAVEVLRILDRAFSERYHHLKRGLPCEECKELGEKELRPDDYEDNCDGPHCHNLEPKLKDLLSGASVKLL